jgi:DNA-directed RNA polymerase subunit L
MDFGTVILILGIVAITAFARVQRARYQAQHGIVEDRKGRVQLLDRPSPREVELQKEVEDLKERIQVLERIATDGRPAKALAAEIESLRDA